VVGKLCFYDNFVEKKLKGEMKAMEERMTTTIKETKQDMQAMEERMTTTSKETKQDMQAMEERMTTTSKETQQELKQLNGAASEVKGCLETIVKLLGRED
jgi:septin family protein